MVDNLIWNLYFHFNVHGLHGLQGLLIVFFSLFLPKFSFLSVHRTNSISYWVSFPTWGRWPNGVRTSSTSSTCKEMRPHKPYSWKCSTQRSDESAKIGKQLFIHRCLNKMVLQLPYLRMRIPHKIASAKSLPCVLYKLSLTIRVSS